jgi:hypothetical protein
MIRFFSRLQWKLALSYAVVTAGTVMVAVLPLILGFQMMMQALTQEVQSSPGAAETREYARLLDDRPARLPRR